MTPRFEIVEARAFHCGQMARALRHDHAIAMARIGADPHRELRACFDQSAFRKAWLIDGRLGALGGVMGTLSSGDGMVWLAFTQEASRYPKQIIVEARRQLDMLMRAKRGLSAAIHEDDPASLRLALFLGFHATTGNCTDPALTRMGRRLLAREITRNVDVLTVIDKAVVIPLAYSAEAA